MGWKRKLKIGCSGGLLLLVAAVALTLYFAPWVPAVQLAEPGATGRRVAEGGLLGNYFPGSGEGRRPAVLLLGGSEGGLGESTQRVALALQAEGFSVLQLSYHRAPGQPRDLEMIPLEYFSAAITWLQRRPEVDPGRIGIAGASKGAEAALLAATRDPRIRAVVAAMPSSVAWQGSSLDRGGTFGSSWSEGGRPLEHLSYGRWRWWRSMTPILSDTLADLPRHPGAAIPVERTAARVLLVCGEADTLWPSCPMARQVERRARAHGRPRVLLLAYPDAGHSVFGLPREPSEAGYSRLGSLGGSNEGNNRARRHGWPFVVAFLKAALEAPARASN
jgi:dienelactone hydrolase